MSEHKTGKGKWKEGTVQEFLGLPHADMELIEIRIAWAKLLKKARIQQKLTQQALARKLHTSQSRLAKMEGGDDSVSLDLICRSLFSLGISRRELAASL